MGQIGLCFAKTVLDDSMVPRYMIGQKVVVVPPENSISPRDSSIEPFAGQVGKVIDYHWISMRGQVFYVYTVKIGTDEKEMVLHEDELEPVMA